MARLIVTLDLPEVAHHRIDATDAADLVLDGTLPRFVPGEPFDTDEVEMVTMRGYEPIAGTYVSAVWATGLVQGRAAEVVAEALSRRVPLHDSPAEHAARILAALEAAGLQVQAVTP